MEKVKVSLEVGEALQCLQQNLSFDKIMEFHNMPGNIWGGGLAPLRKLNNETLAKALLIGYEVEKPTTPAEKIKQKAEEVREEMVNNSLSYTILVQGEAFLNGIKFALDVFDIKIEGVNA